MDISKVLDINRIDLDLKAITKDEVIVEMANLFEKSGVLFDKKQFILDVYEREKEGVTGMGNGFCIPHGKSDAVKQTSIAIGRTGFDIEWESLDDKPIRVVVMMAIKSSDKSELVSILSQIAVKLCDDYVVSRLFNSNSREEIVELFSKGKEDNL